MTADAGPAGATPTTYEATLLHDAWIETPAGKAAQLRLQALGGDGKTINAAMDLRGAAELDAARAGLARLRAGLPVTLAGTSAREDAAKRTLRTSWIGERAMPGADVPEAPLSIGRPPQPKTVAKAGGPGTVGILRRGAASIIDTSLHDHEGGPEHLAAVQKHAGSLLGALKGGVDAAKAGFAAGARRERTPPGAARKTTPRAKRRDDFGR